MMELFLVDLLVSQSHQRERGHVVRSVEERRVERVSPLSSFQLDLEIEDDGCAFLFTIFLARQT